MDPRPVERSSWRLPPVAASARLAVAPAAPPAGARASVRTVAPAATVSPAEPLRPSARLANATPSGRARTAPGTARHLPGLLVALAVGAAAGLGFLFGRSSGGDGSRQESAVLGSTAGSAPAGRSAGLTPASLAPAGFAAFTPTGPAIQNSERLAADRAGATAPEAPDAPPNEACRGEQEEEDAAAEALLAELLSDPEALRAALDRLRSTDDPRAAADLAAILGQVRDPAVEALARELAVAGRTPALRAAAFDILDRFDTPDVLPLVLATLSREGDAAVRRAALMAVPEPAGTSLAEAERLVIPLGEVLAHDHDPEMRRQAAIVLGGWHRSVDDLAGVLRSLASDPDPGVRAGCAFAVEVSGNRDPSVIRALVAALGAPGEDDLVRENAWHALGRMGPLPAAAEEAYRAYAAERVTRDEAGGLVDG